MIIRENQFFTSFILRTNVLGPKAKMLCIRIDQDANSFLDDKNMIRVYDEKGTAIGKITEEGEGEIVYTKYKNRAGEPTKGKHFQQKPL